MSDSDRLKIGMKEFTVPEISRIAASLAYASTLPGFDATLMQRAAGAVISASLVSEKPQTAEQFSVGDRR